MKYLLSLLFIVLIQSTIFAQNNVSITYEHAIMDKKVTRSDKPEFLKGISYTLLCTPTEYWFDVNEVMDDELMMRNGRYTRAGGRNKVFKSLVTNEKFQKIEFKGVEMLMEIDFDTQWEITKETKEISGYHCIKAKTITYDDFLGEPIINIVWFTPEISLPYGPKGFDGLPGLILELNVGKHIMVAKKIDFETKFEILKPEGKSLSKTEVFDIMGIDIKSIRKKILEKKR